jgi:hypothetical protein
MLIARTGGRRGCRRQGAVWTMCGKCDEIDLKMARYTRIAAQIGDQIAQDGIAGLIEKMKAEKAALHPEPEKK